jgi:hypothetical protein
MMRIKSLLPHDKATFPQKHPYSKGRKEIEAVGREEKKIERVE